MRIPFILRNSCACLATLVLAAFFLPCVHSFAQVLDDGEILQLRKQLKHQEVLDALNASNEKTIDPVLLSTLAVEASLLDKLGPPDKRRSMKPKAAVERLATLNLSAREEVVLAELCYLIGLIPGAENAIGRARDKNPELKNRTDEILAEERNEDLPRGGYFRYRGAFIPMEIRDRQRALDLALEALHDLEIKGLIWRFIPSRTESNLERFLTHYGDEGPAFLVKAATQVRKELQVTYREIRGWIPSYSSGIFRQKIQLALEQADPVQKEALKLIGRYDKPQQPEVDEFRKNLEALYTEYERLIDANLGKLRNIRPERGYNMIQRITSCENALAEIDRYLKVCSLPGLQPMEIKPGRGADVSTRHLLPGREQSNLEDVLWVVLHHAAGLTMDVLQRTDELMRQKNSLTTWEKWIIGALRIEVMERYNRQVATSLDPVEREFIEILNRYRKIMGLSPFEVEERCVVAARKHSQEMVDLDYFGHISPVRRNRTPTDRVKLEGFGGGVGENCLAGGGGVSARGAFEGWYHSPGHHRLLVSGSQQVGVGAAGGHRMWTMVAGGLDRTWRSLHKDLPPEERSALEEMTARYGETVKKDEFSGKTKAQLTSALPSVLPFLAKEAFEAVHAKSGTQQARAPAFLEFLIKADVAVEWRPLQVAAVSAVIDLLDIGSSTDVREAANELICPLVPSLHGYDATAGRTKRRSAVVEIRRDWEDEAQWRYRKVDLAEVREPERPMGRVGDGPALTAPLKVLTRKERRRLAKLHGGGAHTERAVDLGLEWLAKVQSEDGAWRSRSFSTRLPRHLEQGQLGMGNAEWEVAMTGLALLAFIYAGNTTHECDYAENVDLGAKFLISRITDYGKFETTSSHYMYSHAMATQALCELYGHTADPYIGVVAQLAVDYLIYAQHPGTGGWRYRAKEAGDMSVTGWVILAMHSAKKAQLDIAGIRDALRFIDRVTYPYYFETGYTSNRDGGQPRLCAVGSASRLFITGNVQDARIYFNARRLLRSLPEINKEDFYYWYYATLLMFQMGDKYWKPWNEAMVPAVLNNQMTDRASPLCGSFNPRGQHAGTGGRVYQTSMGVLILMVYYRYDRGITPKVGPGTGNITRDVEPYLDALRRTEDVVVIEVTERKMMDKFGVALASALIKELKKPDQKAEYRKRLASLLCRCAKPRFESFILDLLKSEKEHPVKLLLMQSLDGISSQKSVPSLIKYLNDGNRDIRGWAASALGRIGDQTAIKPLSDRLQKEKDNWCRARIEEALQRLAHRASITLILDDALKKNDSGRLAIQEKLEVLERTGLARLLLIMKDEEPRLYLRVKAALREHKEWASVPIALIGMESADFDTRSESVKVLQAITRRNHGYDPARPKADRETALEKWQEWWTKQLEDFGG